MSQGVSNGQEKRIQAVQCGVQKGSVETGQRRWDDGQSRLRGTRDQFTAARTMAKILTLAHRKIDTQQSINIV